MFSRIYIEEGIVTHPRACAIIDRFPDIPVVECSSYNEVFNRKAQDFRLQKKFPALILAAKKGKRVLPAPGEYGIGGDYNYYFSHMLNCLYDCRYCFLQGMYRSAHYVLFVNYEDFFDDILHISQSHNAPDTETHFFSGYDCDSLALEPVSAFVTELLPLLPRLGNARIELRTKSTQIRQLLASPASANCIIAYTLTPDRYARALEHRAPDLHSRLKALQKLQGHGWPVGLRFDPLLFDTHYREEYRAFFETCFSQLDVSSIHSVSLGTFRLPRDYYRRMSALYPDEKLFASPLTESNSQVHYNNDIRTQLYQYCLEELLQYIPARLLFPCEDLIACTEDKPKSAGPEYPPDKPFLIS